MAAGVAASSLALLFLDLSGYPGLARPLLDLPSILVLFPVLALLSAGVLVWGRLVGQRPWREVWRRAARGPLSTERLAAVLIVVVLLRLLMLNAVAWKYGIPRLHPFAYDEPLAAWDRALGGGDPWRWLAALTYPPVLRTLDLFYELWFVAFLAAILWWAWEVPSERRSQFLTAMTLLWVGGSLLAVLVPSAGPVYYTRVTGHPGPYADLLPRLASAPLASTLQAALWSAYVMPAGGVVKGIAAFPSLHVAGPALCAIQARGWLRWMWSAFTALTIASSIVLAWHYALDGYAGILLAALVWYVAKWLA
jgi:hypothetical protein